MENGKFQQARKAAEKLFHPFDFSATVSADYASGNLSLFKRDFLRFSIETSNLNKHDIARASLNQNPQGIIGFRENSSYLKPPLIPQLAGVKGSKKILFYLLKGTFPNDKNMPYMVEAIKKLDDTKQYQPSSKRIFSLAKVFSEADTNNEKLPPKTKKYISNMLLNPDLIPEMQKALLELLPFKDQKGPAISIVAHFIERKKIWQLKQFTAWINDNDIIKNIAELNERNIVIRTDNFRNDVKNFIINWHREYGYNLIPSWKTVIKSMSEKELNKFWNIIPNLLFECYSLNKISRNQLIMNTAYLSVTAHKHDKLGCSKKLLAICRKYNIPRLAYSLWLADAEYLTGNAQGAEKLLSLLKKEKSLPYARQNKNIYKRKKHD